MNASCANAYPAGVPVTFIYATVDDLEAWTQADVPDNADALLRQASTLVTEAIRTVFYTVDSNGKASDTTVLATLKDATCAQVEFWIAADINPMAGGVQATLTLQQTDLGSGRVRYDNTSGLLLTQARIAGATTLCPNAVTILNEGGLLYGKTTVYG